MKDTVAEIYLPPFLMRTIGEATRATLATANNAESILHTSPNDYILYHIGSFDDNTGQYQMNESEFKIGSIQQILDLEKNRQDELKDL